MIFHFNKDWLPGGFAGVDVFFVISGYLMTSIIFRGIDNNNFSLWKFYSARIRRIIPALLVLIVILMIFGYLFLAPIPYRELAKHSGGSLLFISNFMYWQEAGYFDAEAIEKFLLHTWSLSVEWQFYIIYPVILLLLAKLFSAKTIKKIIAIATIFAFFFAVYSSFKWNTASYFLLPSRIWEMLLGGIVFLYPLKLSKPQYKHPLELIGLGLIVLSFFIISEQTVWPGYMALIPTGGAFLLLQANNQTSYFTNNLVMQKLGLWSYSLYLYHWPLLVVNHKFNLQLSIWVFLVITIVLSVLSYYFIEIKRWKVWHIFFTTVLVTIIAFGITFHNKNQTESDHNFYLSSILGHNLIENKEIIMNWGSKQLNKDLSHNQEILLFGDSHAAHYSYGITSSNRKLPINLEWIGSCLSFPNFYSKNMYSWQDESWVNNCQKQYSRLQEPNEKIIIISQSWHSYKTRMKCRDNKQCMPNKDYFTLLATELQIISKNNPEAKLILIGVVPAPKISKINCFNNKSSNCPKTYTELGEGIIEVNSALEKISSNLKNTYFIDPTNFLCDSYTKECLYAKDGYSIYFDSGHLSAWGSKLTWEYIENTLQQMGLI